MFVNSIDCGAEEFRHFTSLATDVPVKSLLAAGEPAGQQEQHGSGGNSGPSLVFPDQPDHLTSVLLRCLEAAETKSGVTKHGETEKTDSYACVLETR